MHISMCRVTSLLLLLLLFISMYDAASYKIALLFREHIFWVEYGIVCIDTALNI